MTGETCDRCGQPMADHLAPLGPDDHELRILQAIYGPAEVPTDPICPWTDEQMAAQVASINAALDRLEPAERHILVLRFGLDRGEPRTLTEVGTEVGVSPGRVRQIEHRAMAKLRSSDD